MNTAGLIYGEADEVADFLATRIVDTSDVVPALINALKRIAILERELQNLKDKLNERPR